MDRLKGRAAVVTGGASGIGRASAELFAAEGARVLVVDRPDSNLTFADGAIHTFAVDLAGADAPRLAILAAAIEAFGGLDILFNNAGVGANALAAETSDETWDAVQAVNLARRLSPLPRSHPRAHPLTRRADHQHRQRHGQPDRLWPRRLLRLQGRRRGADANPGPRTWQARRHRQCHSARRHPHRHDAAKFRRSSHRGHLGQEVGPATAGRTHRRGQGGALPRLGRRRLRHRPGDRRRWRPDP